MEAHSDVMTDKPKMSKSRKWLWGIGIFLALGVISQMVNPSDRPAGTPSVMPTPTVSATASATATATASATGVSTPPAPTIPAAPAPAPAPSRSPTPKVTTMSEQQLQAWADQVNADARSQFPVKSWQETCLSPTPGWSCLVTDMSSPQEGILVVVLQISDKDPAAKGTGENAAYALFHLLQVEHPELTMIQVVHAGGGPLITLSRSSALPLEK